jgi:DNA-binding LacI/PurR family transcriptional regulator
MKNKRITILDVARESGVTDGTVSRALAGDKRVSPSTLERVLKAAEKLNYQPHLYARSLRRQESRNLGVFWQGGSWLFYNHYYGSLLSGLAESAEKDKTHLVFYLPEMKPTEDPNPLHQFVRMTGIHELMDGRVEGAVVLSFRTIPEDQLSVLRRSALPIVLMSMHREVPGFFQLSAGTYERTSLAAEKLLEAGHRRIGFLGFYVESPHDDVVCAAMGDALRKRGLVFEKEWLESSDHWNIWDTTRIEGQLKRLLERKCTAVICVSADQAALGIEVLRKLGLEVPRDISLVAFGPLSPVAQFHRPSLCLIEPDLVNAGIGAYELYKEAKDGKTPRGISIDWRWAGIGESIGPPKK